MAFDPHATDHDFDTWWQHARIVMGDEARRRRRREVLQRLDSELAARREEGTTH